MNTEIKESLYKMSKAHFTKKLRREMTSEEVILWQLLRNRYSRGVKFRRQVNIGPYIVDFLSKEHRVIIEVDGGVHDTEDQINHDITCDEYLKGLGYYILRIRNEELHTNLSTTLRSIHNFLQTVPSPSQRRGLG